MHNLIEKMFSFALSNDVLLQSHDSAQITLPQNKIAFTTDSYVVKPLFFPGGDIGSLAVNGTVNDLAMSGAIPMYISLGLIIEEGFAMEELWKVIQSIAAAAEAAGVKIATGDTKVVDKGKGDGIFINTSGIGVIEHSLNISPKNIHKGDVIILNGDIGRHGIAIMAEREGLEFDHKIKSDCAPLHGIVNDIIDSGIDVHCMRDLTRGGLSSTLNELADSAKCEIEIDEVTDLSSLPREDLYAMKKIKFMEKYLLRIPFIRRMKSIRRNYEKTFDYPPKIVYDFLQKKFIKVQSG